MKNSLLFLLIFCSCFSCIEQKQKVVSTLEPEVSKEAVEETKEAVLEEIKTPIIDYDTTQWAEILFDKEGIRVDMKYATEDNFVKEKMYNCGRCFLRPEVAEALVEAQEILKEQKLGLKVYDCYRPRPVQKLLWKKVPNASYVTPPSKGSMHNRGTAVDLTLVDAEGKTLDMGTIFDFFGKRAHHDYTDLPKEVLNNRKLLKKTMKKVGFLPIRTEWWHYYFAHKAPAGHELSDYIWPCDSLEEGI